MQEIKEGTRVKYIHEDSEERKALGCYPPVGTLGTVQMCDELTETYKVKWDEGTTGDGVWFCDRSYVEVVEESKNV